MYCSEEEYIEPEVVEVTENSYVAGAQDDFDFRIKVRAFKGAGADRTYGEWSSFATGSAYKRRKIMPFISTKTNVTVSKEKETQLKERLGQAISIIPGKSENWLMLAIEGDIPMYFRGDDSQPTAFIEVKIFGNASSDVYGRMTKELTGIYGDILGVAPDHMYIRYFGSDDWGWNGNNF